MSAFTATQFDVLELTFSPGGANGATATVTDPSGNVRTLYASSASALPSVWTVLLTVGLVGVYSVAWAPIGTGPGQTDTITVSEFEPVPLLSIDDCYMSLNMPEAMRGSNSDRDADMLAYALAAQSVVENIVGKVTPAPVWEVFDGGEPSVQLGQRPTSIVSILENGVQISDFVWDVGAGIIRAGTTWWNRPFWPGQQNVEVRYMVGEGRVSPNVMLAIREEFRFLWQIGRQGNRSDAQQMGESSTGPGFAVPNRVYELLANERILPGFA